MIVGPQTKTAFPEMQFLELDPVKVKGKNEPVSIFAPVGETNRLDANTLDALEKWREMLQAFRAQQWQLARGLLDGIDSEVIVNPILLSLYAHRIDHFEANPPPEHWDGVTQFDTK